MDKSQRVKLFFNNQSFVLSDHMMGSLRRPQGVIICVGVIIPLYCQGTEGRYIYVTAVIWTKTFNTVHVATFEYPQ